MPTQQDQQSVVPNPRVVKPVYVPQQTLQYKTFLKRTITEALQNAFGLYNLKEPEPPHQYDATLGKAKIGPDYQTTRVNFPSVVVKFYEQQIINAGVGHMEWGPETTEINLTGIGHITRGSGEITGLDTTDSLLPGITEVKGNGIPKGAIVIRVTGAQSVLINKEAFETRETNLTIRGELNIDENFIEYHHSIYHGDIALEVYGLNSPDRDKVADALVEIVQMGVVGAEGKSFQERIYDTIGLSPYSQWHFIAINTDLFKGYGEREELAPWMPEDTWVYRAEYRVPIIGEFYSITPKQGEGTLNLVKRVKVYPWLPANAGISDEPSGQHGEIEPDEFPEGKVPDEDYYNIPPIVPFHTHGSKADVGLAGRLVPIAYQVPPTIELLDALNKAPISGNWTLAFGRAHEGVITEEGYGSEDNGNSEDGMFWNPQEFENAFVIATIKRLGNTNAGTYQALYAGLQNPATEDTGYALQVEKTISGEEPERVLGIWKTIKGEKQQIGTVKTPVSIGDKYAIQVTGSTVVAWLEHAGEWKPELFVFDSSFNKGYIGIGARGTTLVSHDFEVGIS